MPDSKGAFKGISVPAIPWHERAEGERALELAEKNHCSFNRCPYDCAEGSCRYPHSNIGVPVGAPTNAR